VRVVGRWGVRTVLGVLLLLATAVPGLPQSTNLVPVLSHVTPSVALVVSEDENGHPFESGSAFVVDDGGLLLTALHVVATARQISVTLPDRPALGADVIAIDEAHDVALLRAPSFSRGSTAALPLGDSGALQAGEGVVVVGYPLASPHDAPVTVTQGIVSALRTDQGYIQIDASVNPGESGGPVLTRDGKVIGIVDASVEGAQNFNLAVPISFGRTLLERAGGSGSPVDAIALPLTSASPVPLGYASGGIGPHGHQDGVGVQCAAPPPRAAVLDAVGAMLTVGGTLHVVTWLSTGKGAALNSAAAFGRVDGTSARQFSGVLPRLNLPPATICLNYTAWNDSVLPIGFTFNVAYSLGYRVFRTSLVPAAH